MNPMGMTIDPITTEIVVADSWNHRIRGINRATSTVRTIAGSEIGNQGGPAATALFYYPTDVVADPQGRLYVTAPGDFMLFKIDNDLARTVYIIVTGSQNANDGDGEHAGLAVHLGLGWANGKLIASDGAANRIRRIAPDPDPDLTEVSTLAGKGRYGLIDGAGDTAGFAMPAGIAVGPDGTIYVADTGNGAVRAIQP
jgi:DNA-binding beta-propeller fold protein YncE